MPPAVIHYPGHHLHGRRVSEASEPYRAPWGEAVDVKADDGITYALPAERVRMLTEDRSAA